MDIARLLELYRVKMESDGESVLEILIDYLRALSSICKIYIVCILKYKAEIQQLYEFCFMKRYTLLILNGRKTIL